MTIEVGPPAVAQRGAELDQVLAAVAELQQQQSDMDARHKASQEVISQQVEAILTVLRKRPMETTKDYTA